MEHLKRPSNPINPRVEVPCIVTTEYDGGDFCGYPERQGVDKDSLLNGDFDTTDLPSLHAFIQSWLFFGFAIEFFKVLGVTVKTNELVRTAPDGRPLVTTEKLNDYIDEASVMYDRCSPRTEIDLHFDQLEFATSHTVIEATSKLMPNLIPGRQSRLVWTDVIRKLDKILAEACFYVSVLLPCSSEYASRAGQLPGGKWTTKFAMKKEISFSIINLGWALAHARNKFSRDMFLKFWPQEPPSAPDEPDFRMYRRDVSGDPQKRMAWWGFSDLTLDRLKVAYPCPTFDQFLREEFMFEGALFYLSELERKPFHEDHSKCTEQTCIANQIDKYEYKVMHWNCDGSCPEVTISSAGPDAGTILRDGHIPVVSSIQQEQTGWTVTMKAASPETPYCAISHVWSHGLGNPNTNALPKCQVSRLLAYVNERETTERESSCFWIDTLCVPLEKELRKLALSKISTVYRQAKTVMVVDAELIRYNHSNAHESLMRMSVSDWSRRVWTLQESSLSRKLLIRFNNVAVDLKSELQQELRTLEPFGEYALADPLWSTSKLLFKLLLRANDGQNLGAFERLPEQMQYRTISKAPDEVLCLASMLGLDVAAIVQEPDPSRMQLLYKLAGTIPMAYLFLECQRLESEGFRWAPKSLINMSNTRVLGNIIAGQPSLNTGGQIMDILRFMDPDGMGQLPAPEPPLNRDEGRLDADGLHIQGPGFLLDTSDCPVEHFPFSTLNEPTIGGRAWTAVNNGNDCLIYFVCLHLDHLNAEQRSRITNPAIILRNSVSDCRRIGYTDEHACVLTNLRVVDNEIRGSYVCCAYVTWGLADGSDEIVLQMFRNAIQMGPKLGLRTGSDIPGVVAVERYDVDQRWCID